MGAVIAIEGNRATVLTSNRGRRKQPFSEPERKIAQALLPHLARAHGLQRRLHLQEASRAVLDTLPMGVVFLAASGGAIYPNRAAEEIFRLGDGLSLRNGMLCATDSKAHAQLREAIRRAISPGCSLDCAAAVLVSRPSLRPPYQVVASPLRCQWPDFVGVQAPVAVVLISGPEQQRPPAPKVLQQLYGLTPKEAAIAAKISEGKSLEQAAEELHMRYETARTHLRRIFDKTGSSRQAELAVLVARLPGAPVT